MSLVLLVIHGDAGYECVVGARSCGFNISNVISQNCLFPGIDQSVDGISPFIDSTKGMQFWLSLWPPTNQK